MKIYLATSWKNQEYSTVLEALRDAGHEVYDFRNPPGITDPLVRLSPEDSEHFDWHTTDTLEYLHALPKNPIARAKFKLDKDALDWCDVLVCLLPCGKSGHLEAGYTIGRGKLTYFLFPAQYDVVPELMYLLGDGMTSELFELVEWLK